MRVLLVPNAANPRSIEATRTAAAWLAARGIEVVLEAHDAEACGLPEHGVPRSDARQADLAVALGGDGTMLKAVHTIGSPDVPLLGVNLGRLGFLSGAESEHLEQALEAALAGEARVERRGVLEASVVVGGREAGTFHALNEVFVGRSGVSRAVELEVAANGVVLWRFVCDGVVLATPTGSTAYALSAGGPIVSPEVRGMLIVPVAAHALSVRPVVVGPSDVVEVSCPNPARAGACVTVDGDEIPCRRALERVTVTAGSREAALLKIDGEDFYRVLATKLLER
ncbi:NAD(+)/NADH kinase [Coriobacteriia bacterium Es71-Z0120]|uniref:NAD(+)/NADH kinase n=1 Tax=Parvivirga hydrogeniphila TaxID=2939460 RepID=UPI002260BB9B|nr:NAD(+)/NADH kinase [Parvivirga hydrogeniphila]MCL4079133.1 NAD(+)/NADH kinase [Parvivirga hydrogeniphila]